MAVLSENAETIARSRYYEDGENWEKLCIRVAENVSSVEVDKKKWKDAFANEIFEMNFIPAGRILRNSGKPQGTVFNCYVIPIGDSRKEIGRFYSDAFVLWGEGGGIGVNLSSIRPDGDPVKGVGGVASGPVSFLHAADAIAQTVESGGSRRAAALALLNVTHPDIFKFIDAKIKDKLLPHFNISVAITDDFLDSVEHKLDIDLSFAQKVYKKINSSEIWEKIVTNMIDFGEPGLVNWSRFSRNNSYYFAPVLCCNPCGEAILGPYQVCDLGSLVLTKFISGSSTSWKKLEDSIRIAVRFLDNVTDVNKYVLDEIKTQALNSRRIGLGVMGLAEYLFAKKLRYGSDKAILEVERLMRFIRDTVYDELINLACEKGVFPKFDSTEYSKASFIRKLPATLRMKIKEHGVRCTTALSIAPTGTISLLADVTSGIEPLFSKAYKRSDRVGERIYIHPLYKEFLKSDKETEDWFVDVNDLTPVEHFEIQAAIQKYVDGAVSKTINLPKETSSEELSKWLLEFMHDLKGCTVYRDGSREGQVLNHLTKKDIEKYINESEETMSTDDVGCARGVCET